MPAAQQEAHKPNSQMNAMVTTPQRILLRIVNAVLMTEVQEAKEATEGHCPHFQEAVVWS